MRYPEQPRSRAWAETRKNSLQPRKRFLYCASPHQWREQRFTAWADFLSPKLNRCGGLFWTGNANDQSTCAERTTEGVGEIEITGLDRLSAAARGLRSGNDADAEEAEFCFAQSGESAADQWPGSDCLHSGRGSQSAGTLDRAGARWPGEGFAGCALPYCPWDARFPRG